MDLNLYLGPPLSSPHRPRSAVGSDLALSSPSPAASPPSYATVEPMAPPPEPLHAPYSPSRAAIMAAPGRPLVPGRRPPPLFAGGGVDGPVQEFLPRSPSYRGLSRPYVPVPPPPPPSPPLSSRPPDADYSLPYVPAFPADRNSNEAFVVDGGGSANLLPYDPLWISGFADAPLVGAGGGGGGGGSSRVRYSPSYVPLSSIPEDHEDANFAPFRAIDDGTADIFEGEDGSSPQPDFVDQEFRIRRLIELQRRSQEVRLSRSSHPYGDEVPDYAPMMNSGGSVGNSRKNEVGDEGIRDEDLEEEKEEKNASAINFECNICLDLAQEPVVTSCGHLFCWPCLYQWLHLHCNHSECPVCKGEVTESSITPIYGRGSSETSSKEGRAGDSGLKIPPRPRGRRIESWRQRLRRPISRRFSVGIANTWRRVLGEDTRNRIDGDVETSLREMINSAHRRVAPRLRARRSTRVETNLENGSFSIAHTLPTSNALPNQQSEGNTGSIVREGLNNWPRLSFVGFDGSSGLATVSANLSRIFGRSVEGGSHSGASASSGNPQIPDDPFRRPSIGSSQAMDQASASSTMAVIQGDGGIVDVAAEPNSAGTSRPFRRRLRGSSSLDVDGCALHARKRRRLN